MSPVPALAARDWLEPVGGVALHCREIGAGPRVLVLHGGPGAHHDYLLPQFDELALGRSLLYYDQRGGGRSPVPRDVAVTWQDHVADLKEIAALAGPGPATILGYSWGGLLALLFATRHPELVGALALVSPAPSTASGLHRFERSYAERMRDPRILEARRELQQSDLRERDGERYRQRLFELSVAGYFADPALASNLTPFRVTGRVQGSVWRSLGDYDIRDEIGRLDMPALVMHGRHDPIPCETAEETARLLGTECRILENSGHVPYVEETNEFVRLLDDFLPRD